MLTRVYIDNYLCFVNFEYRPERKELIFGGNGSGKSSFCQTLMTIRRFLLGEKVDDCFPVQKRSRYSNGKGDQHFELDVLLNDRLYEYSLSLIPNADDQRTIVHWEALKCDSKDIFKGFDGIVMQYKVDDETVYLADPQYKVGPHRSADRLVP